MTEKTDLTRLATSEAASSSRAPAAGARRAAAAPAVARAGVARPRDGWTPAAGEARVDWPSDWPSDWVRLLEAPEEVDPLAPLWMPRDDRRSPERAHAPFLFWLMGSCRPRGVALLGLGDGIACHALCEGAERLGLAAPIVAYAEAGEAEALGPDYARAAEAAGARHRLDIAPPERAHEAHSGPTDLLCVLAPLTPALRAALAERWLAGMAAQGGGVVLVFGDAEPDLPALARPLLSFRHAGGLCVATVGPATPDAVARLARSATAQRRAALLFERLGTLPERAAGADGARSDALAAIAEDAQRHAREALVALKERSDALAEARDRAGALERDLRLARERNDALWDAMQAAPDQVREAREAVQETVKAERLARSEAERRLERTEGDRDAAHRAREEVERRLLATEEALRAERRRSAAAEQRSEATFAERYDPWTATRATLLGAELAARRSPQSWLLDPRRLMAQPSTRRQVAAILASPLFDAGWYARTYPDAARAPRAGPRLDRILGRSEARHLARHYLNHGASEGRDPGPRFSTRQYYLQHPDVASAGWNALVHYEAFGRAEGRVAVRIDATDHEFSRDVALIEASSLFDPEWYVARHPDIPPGMKPSEHYLAVGAAVGYDPGPRFGTRPYEEANPDIRQAGINPLVHYLRYGHEEGRAVHLGGGRNPRQLVEGIRAQLLSFGFTEPPLRELRAAAEGEDAELRMRASLELGRWHLRPENGPDPAAALPWLDAAAKSATTREARDKIAVMLLACLHRLGRAEDAARLLAGVRAMGLMTPDLMLARSMIEPDEAERIAAINEAMRAHGLPDVALRPAAAGLSLYDRLRTAGEPKPVTGGPLVSVVVAAYKAEATLPLTLMAMREQSWRHHEVIVVDDASPDGTRAVAERFAREDPRVRVLPLARNVGAYAARNQGLAVARGEFVTLQDADDWSHATRLEIQARHLVETPAVVANTTEQTRMRDDLAIAHWSAQGDLTFPNFASIMFRTDPVRRELGGWDEVRFSADNEMLRRMRLNFGRGTVRDLRSGPVTFQRYAEGSAITDLETGFNGALSGARLEYFEAQTHHRSRQGAQRYDRGSRPFPVPAIMRPDARRGEARRFDVVVGSDLRMRGGATEATVEEIRAQRAAGLGTGLVKLYRYDLPQRMQLHTLPRLRDEIDGEAVSMLSFGERASCDLLVIRHPAVLQHAQRFTPRIEPARVKVVLDALPSERPDEQGGYDLATVEANLRRVFGRPGEWHPTDPGLRDALLARHRPALEGIDLRPEDWIPILDGASWDRGLGGGPRPDRGGPLRIGRHGRDDAAKWPASAEELLAIYPVADDVEVRVLGGAEAPIERLGRLPANWSIEPFGAQDPQAFLAEIDVFVHYADPSDERGPGRAVLEAMAAGVPVVLPPQHEASFGEAALYAHPADAADAARRLHVDPDAYRAQALRAQAWVRERHGPARHVARLEAAGVGQAGVGRGGAA